MHPPVSRRTLSLVLVAGLFLTIYVVRIQEDMVDFQVNYRAGERIRAGETLYQTSDGHFMFKYLPFSALIYVPFTFVPVETAKAFWYVLSVFAAFSIFVLSKRLVSEERAVSGWLLALPPIVLAKFCFRELKLGQINLFVVLVLLWMTSHLLRKTRTGDAAAGAFGLSRRR